MLQRVRAVCTNEALAALGPFDAAITMGCGGACPHVRARTRRPGAAARAAV